MSLSGVWSMKLRFRLEENAGENGVFWVWRLKSWPCSLGATARVSKRLEASIYPGASRPKDGSVAAHVPQPMRLFASDLSTLRPLRDWAAAQVRDVGC